MSSLALPSPRVLPPHLPLAPLPLRPACPARTPPRSPSCQPQKSSQCNKVCSCEAPRFCASHQWQQGNPSARGRRGDRRPSKRGLRRATPLFPPPGWDWIPGPGFGGSHETATIARGRTHMGVAGVCPDRPWRRSLCDRLLDDRGDDRPYEEMRRHRHPVGCGRGVPPHAETRHVRWIGPQNLLICAK